MASSATTPATATRQLPGGERYREARKVTLVGGAVDLALGVLKIAVGWAAQSQALLADGVHSLSDLATDVGVIVAARHASRDADENHPYGHGRIETLATIGLGVSLIAVAIGIAWDSVRRLFQPELLLEPGMWALVAAAASVAAKEWAYRYTMRAARRLRSSMLRANAWHSRSDALSSVVVMVGVGGTMAGLAYVDAVAAVIVAAMVAKIGWDFAHESARELIDTGLAPEEVERIRDSILAVDGVRSMHTLRTRRMGRDALVDVHIQVDPKVSVSEGHQIAEAARARLVEEVEDVNDVLVHIDPEDDEDEDEPAPDDMLPLRQEVLERLDRRWRETVPGRDIRRVTLHYLDGRVHVDVVLPLDLAADADAAERARRALREAVAGEPDLGRVEVYFQ